MSIKKALIPCLFLLLSSCIAQPQNIESTVTIAPPTQSSSPVTITGWFTTVWNGEPHYSITDDQGQTTRVLLDVELAKPFGGPLELDRKRVTVTGEFVNDPQGALRILSINIEGGN